MLTCHFCDAELTDSLLQSGRCPNCGGQLRWQGDDEDPALTLRLGRELEARLSEDGFLTTETDPADAESATPDDEPAPTARGEASAGDIPAAATDTDGEDPVNERDTVEPPASEPPPAPDDRRATLTPEILAQVTSVWSSSVDSQSGATPQRTIKTHGSDTVEEHALVIQTRRLGGYDRPLPPRSDYELIEIIGEGGVGVVYQARQNSVDRMVAVKMLKPTGRNEEDAHDKFLSEAVVTGELEHPNIVPIYDLGTNEDGALFYSMKRVVGTPWEQALPGNSLTRNIEILMKVCDAVAFAHSRDVVHRDLKPENVMLGGFGEVLVMDWGIAISTGVRDRETDVRRSATMGGTPAYMAPEMATGPLEKIGVASDVYLLAGILFEIVTGKTPHDGKTVMDCLYAAAANEIQPTDASGELLEIALAAMATNPEDRYQSVEEFQAAIREYQSHSESIALSERARVDLQEAIRDVSYERFARALFAYEEAVSLWPGNEPAREGVVEARRTYAEAALNNDDYELGLSLVNEDDAPYAEVYTALHAGQQEQQQRQERIRGLKRMALWLALIVVLGGMISYVQIRRTNVQIRSSNERITIQNEEIKEQKRVVDEQAVVLRTQASDLKEKSSDLEETVENLERERQNLEREQRRKDYEKYVADIGLAAEQIEASAFLSAQRLLQTYEQTALVNFEWGRQQFLCGPLVDMVNAGEPVRQVRYLGDGRCFVATQRGRFGLFDAGLLAGAPEMHPAPLRAEAAAITMAPDGRTMAVSTGDNVIELYAVDTAGEVQRLKSLEEQHSGKVTSLRFSPDGTKLLSTSEDHTAILWDVAGLNEPVVLRGHTWTVWQGAFAPHTAGLLATVGQDGRVILWSDFGNDRRVFYGHDEQPVYAVAFSPDGEWIASGGADGRVLVWRREEALVEDSALFGEFLRGNRPATNAIELTGHRGAVRCLSFSPVPDDELLLSGSDDNTLRLWEVGAAVPEDGLIAPLRGHSRAVTSCDFAPDGQTVLSGSDDGHWKRWDVSGLRNRVLTGHTNEILAARLSRPTSGPPMIATAGRDRTARVWTGRPSDVEIKLDAGHEYLASSVISLPGAEDHVITSGGDNTARLWSLTSGQQLVLQGTGRRAALAVSADGHWVLTGAQPSPNDSSDVVACARLWQIQVRDGKFVASTPEESFPDFKCEAGVQVTAVAIDQVNETYYVGDTRGVGRLWRRGNDEPLQLIAHEKMITAAAFLPGGRLVTASGDPTVSQWDVASGTEIQALRLAHNGWVTGLSVSPDGRTALTTSLESLESANGGALEQLTVVRLWDLDAAAEMWRIDVPHEHSDEHSDFNKATGVLCGFAADGRQFFVGNLAAEAGRHQRFRVYQFEWDGGPDWQPGEFQDIEAANAWSAAFSDDGSRLITLGGDALQVWKIDTGRRVTSLRRQSVVSSVDISPDARHVVTASWDLEVRVWDVETGSVIRQLRNGDEGATFAVRFSPDGQAILTAGEYGLILWMVPDDQRIDELEDSDRVEFEEASHVVIAAAFSADGRRLAGVCDDNSVRVWSRDSGELVAEIPWENQAPTCCALGPFGQQLAFNTSQAGLVWRIEDGAEAGPSLEFELTGHTGPVTSVAFSPDGRRVVTGSEDGTAKIWDVETRDAGAADTTPAGTREAKQLLTLNRHTEAVTAVDFSADGTIVLTASRDGTAVLWESIPIPPRVRTSQSQQNCQATEDQVLVDQDVVINAPTTSTFEDVTLLVELETTPEDSIPATTDIEFTATGTSPDGNPRLDDALTLETMNSDRHYLPDPGGRSTPGGKVFVLIGNGSALRLSADDASLDDGERIVAVVNGLDTSRLEIRYTRDARLPDVEQVARSVAYRAPGNRSEVFDRTVRYRIRESGNSDEDTEDAVMPEVRIRVKAPDEDAGEMETAPEETNERA